MRHSRVYGVASAAALLVACATGQDVGGGTVELPLGSGGTDGGMTAGGGGGSATGGAAEGEGGASSAGDGGSPVSGNGGSPASGNGGAPVSGNGGAPSNGGSVQAGGAQSSGGRASGAAPSSGGTGSGAGGSNASGGKSGAGGVAGGGSGSGGTATAGASGAGGSCGTMQKLCGGVCVGQAPANGCAAATCSACPGPAPDHGLLICNSSGSCDFECLSGFQKDGAVCTSSTGAGGTTGGGGTTGSGGGPLTCGITLCFLPCLPGSTLCCDKLSGLLCTCALSGQESIMCR